MDADDLADLRRGGRSGIRRRFHCGHVTTEETGHVTAADFFPADQHDVGGLEAGVADLEQGAQSLAFDHSNCLLSHRAVES